MAAANRKPDLKPPAVHPVLSRLQELSAGLRGAFAAGYGLGDLRADILAGLTVGIVAVPLAMALAIATGVPPQHGLYTAIVAGALIALTGGSRFNVSGPTAAFVVVLMPVVQQHGLGGLLLASFMAGALMLVMGLAGMGRLIQFIPYPVIIGFTAGIGVVIATLQLKDLLGLDIGAPGAHFLDNLALILGALPGARWEALLIGALTLAVLLLWGRLRTPLPSHLAALALGTLAAWLAIRYLDGFSVETVASKFSYAMDGETGRGIPPAAPALVWPWELPGPDGAPLPLTFDLIRALIGPAFAIAMLGAIESLLCAVVADGLTGTRHAPNAELIGQGLGNMVVPFFGGITATAAIARTATSIRAGARSPIAALVHALVVLLAVAVFAALLGHLPMAALAALLLVVAWNMSEAKHFVHILRGAPPADVAVLLVCFVLTVLFDMVLAVTVGVALAGLLFIQRMSGLTVVNRVEHRLQPQLAGLPEQVAVYDLDGPLFFGAADRAVSTLRRVDPGVRIVILDMAGVPSIDMTAIVALRTLVDDMEHQDLGLILCHLPVRLVHKLRRGGIRKRSGKLTYAANLDQARQIALRWLNQQSQAVAAAH